MAMQLTTTVEASESHVVMALHVTTYTWYSMYGAHRLEYGAMR